MSASNAPQTFKVGLSPEEKRLYSHLFKTLDPEGTGIITGEKARTTFEKSGLPPAILGEIWQLADKNNLGFLTQFGFCYAMRLIGHTQAGQPPSDLLAQSPGPLPKFAGLSLPVLTPSQSQLQPQSTNNSLMQSQPSAQVPQNTATYQSSPQDPIPPVSPSDYQKFADLFIRTTGSPNNDLAGSSARDIFLKAKLPTPTLGQVWNLVDTENAGKLTMPGFVVAMHLIQGLLSGTIKQLPPFLPDNIWQSAQGTAGQPTIPGSRQSSYASVASQQTVKHVPQPAAKVPSTSSVQAPAYSKAGNDEWTVSETMKQQYENIFNNLDKQKTGKLNPDQVAQFLMTSKLGQQDLATVWDLSDIQNTGIFTKLEFSIALFLVNRKLSGGSLPNIVPEALIKSLSDESASAPQQQQQLPPSTQQQPPKQLTAQKTSMDDLADVFGSPSPAAATTTAPAAPVGRSLQPRVSSSDLTPASDLPKVRKNLTAGFRPTSNFGQTLVSKDLTSPKEEHPDLLGEDVQKETSTAQSAAPAVSTPPVPAASPVPEKKAINYDALRSVPPPPKKTQSFAQSSPMPSPAAAASPTSAGFTPPEVSRNLSSQSFQSPQNTSQSATQANSDLLADPAISGQLSQATSDIANISNQVKSLGSQTSDLHEKKSRAEQELRKILTVKQDIESKLKLLKSSYDNEVKQYQEVEDNLVKAKEETEALRSESSIAEAKLNHLSSELNAKQLEMESLQKENGSIKEKLGNVNAEISELAKQAESVASENQRLTNQLSVKKSQVQVVIVKKQELEAKISETIENNKKLQQEIDAQAEEEAKASREQEASEAKLREVQNFTPTKPEATKETTSSSSKGIIGAAVGAVAGTGIAATVASHLGAKDAEQEEPEEVKEPETEVPSHSKEIDVDTSKETTAGANIAGLVDEVKDKPSSDLTGIEDVQNVDDKPEALGSRLEEATNTTVSSGGNENETPITSPSNSDFQFGQGGSAALPGVFGVQRADSLTSSVQNNAANSVRDDNIDEVSDRETIENSGIEGTPAAEKEFVPPPPVGREEALGKEAVTESDGDKISSGVESFEMVNADDVKEAENYDPKSTTYVFKNAGNDSPEPAEAAEGDINEEFPPIKELDYDESSSDEDFHEATDLGRDLPVVPPATMPGAFTPEEPEISAPAPATAPAAESAPKDEFDNVFDDLEPTVAETSVPETQQKDLFADEFDNLEEAKAETSTDYAGNNTEDFFNNDFTNSSNMPDFSSAPGQPVEPVKTGNDEWEQLFAGFGNSASAQATPQATPQAAAPEVFASGPSSTHHEELIQELVGMGFQEQTAADALQKSGWDVEAATNYLLDNV